MKPSIDCLFIGHNETQFTEYENHVRNMGVKSGAYRDLDLNFIYFNGKPYTASEIFNLFYCNSYNTDNPVKPLNIEETFSATIAYLGTYLHRRGLTFDYITSFQEQKELLEQKLKENEVLTVAITTTLYVSVFPILEIVDFIRKHNRDVRIVVGGPFVSTKVRIQSPTDLETLFKSIDADFYINSSQGEGALVDLIAALKEKADYNGVDNLYYKSNGKYRATSMVREQNVLADNMVDWGLFAGRVGEYAAVRTAISCPFSCSFCGFPEHAGKYQTAGVEAVERELNGINGIESLKSVQFIDDTFNVPPERFKNILRMMIANKYRFKWHSYYRCQYADRETVELMKESGCEGVFLGIESGSDRVLKNMNKAASVEKYLEGIALLKEYGIPTFGNFIIGFPGENRDTVEETKQFIRQGGLDFYRVQLWYCEHITPIWKQRDKYHIKGESFEWSHGGMNSKEASDIIDDIFMSVGESVWVPQYNFDINSIWHMLHRGLNLEDASEFLRNFNAIVREKISNADRKDAGMEFVTALGRSAQKFTGEAVEPETLAEGGESIEADFDF